jgi:hypothetical protein
MFLRNVIYHLYDYRVSQLISSQINNTDRRQNATGEYFFHPKFVKQTNKKNDYANFCCSKRISLNNVA